LPRVKPPPVSLRDPSTRFPQGIKTVSPYLEGRCPSRVPIFEEESDFQHMSAFFDRWEGYYAIVRTHQHPINPQDTKNKQ
jgi:hypothetical protein